MDYVVGSVAALVTGNVTPNRPKLIRRPLTPTKHQPSPNVTPKSELLDDRSIFLSPTLQKKKAVLKKSPKRIFENANLDTTNNSEGSSMSPKTDKVKKDLKNELKIEEEKIDKSRKSKNKNPSPDKSLHDNSNINKLNQNTLGKKKKRSSGIDDSERVDESENLPPQNDVNLSESSGKNKNPLKLKENDKSTVKDNKTPSIEENVETSKTKKRKLDSETNDISQDSKLSSDKLTKSQKKRLKRKLKSQMKSNDKNQSSNDDSLQTTSNDVNDSEASPSKKKKINTENNLSNNQTDTKTTDKLSKSQKRRLRKMKVGNKNQADNKQTSNENNNDSKETVVKSSISEPKDISDKNQHIEIEKHDNQNNVTKKKAKKSKRQDLNQPTSEIAEKSDDKSLKTDENISFENKENSKTNSIKWNTIKDSENVEIKNKKGKKKHKVNPNAITDKDSDSEHDSDDEIHSETEEINKKALENTLVDESSSDEEEPVEKEPKKEKKDSVEHKMDADEVKKTLFVGNVPFSAKCKKQVKKIFSKYGRILTVRIRTVPVKDARVTPKLAVIKNELHPERTTVNMYIKYADAESVEKALAENNTLLDENHLRVTRSDTTGAEHDPRLAIFVGNLPFAIEDDTLRAKFEKCGEIESVRIIRDKKTNAGKGFGYVNFASKDGVELALALTEEDLTIKNRILRVKRCTQTNQKAHRPVNPKWGEKSKTEGSGAVRRLMHKRKNQDVDVDGPPNKRVNMLNQTVKEKKPRKEFVGMTAEKKKKRKFDKGQKKKKALSQILTNKPN